MQRGWVDANRASSKETDKTSYGSTAGITVGVRNVKQTTNILIEKTETNYESTLTRLMLINDKLR